MCLTTGMDAVVCSNAAREQRSPLAGQRSGMHVLGAHVKKKAFHIRLLQHKSTDAASSRDRCELALVRAKWSMEQACQVSKHSLACLHMGVLHMWAAPSNVIDTWSLQCTAEICTALPCQSMPAAIARHGGVILGLTAPDHYACQHHHHQLQARHHID